uniref:Protein FMC1 homolog n=1 Tax=Schistocephalus solidus TaxID=70667 RepID=A0A0X3Q3G4_SCHSO
MSNIGLLRSLIKHIRNNTSFPGKLIDHPFVKYILFRFRYYQYTTEQKCSAKHESMQLVETYNSLLKNIENHKKLVQEYKCKQKSTAEAARLVGLELPKTN